MSLLGVKRTCLFALHMSAFDPKQTFREYYICNFFDLFREVPTVPQGYVLGSREGEHLIQRGGDIFINVDSVKAPTVSPREPNRSWSA